MSAGLAPTEAVRPSAVDTGFFGHPRGLSTLFFTELWERFSYYGMRALLILFMTAPIATGGLGFDAAKAGVIYGTYTALVYMLALPGGWIADRFTGQRRATLYGGITIMLGHVSLAVPSLATFYLGLALVVIGTGLLKPNISVMVGQLYAPNDARRDAGFSIFYMGINTGAFVAPLICGWLAQSEQFRRFLGSVGIAPESSWHWGFGMAAVGMFFGIIQYVRGAARLGDAGLHPVPAASAVEHRRRTRLLQAGLLGIAAVGLLVAALQRGGVVEVTAQAVGDVFGVVLFATVLGFFAWLLASRQWNAGERKRLIVVLVLFVAATIFWSVFEQAGSTLNLFAQRSTRTELFGFGFPASWLQSLGAMFLVIFAPVLAWLWIRLGRRDPSSPTKFTLGLVFVGLGFILLIPPARLAEAGVQVSPLWLTATYFCHTIGELCLSPVGLSAMTRLAPARVAGLTMGVWFLALSAGNYLGGRVASLYEAFTLPGLFTAVGLYALAAAIALAFLIGPIRRMLVRDA